MKIKNFESDCLCCTLLVWTFLVINNNVLKRGKCILHLLSFEKSYVPKDKLLSRSDLHVSESERIVINSIDIQLGSEFIFRQNKLYPDIVFVDLKVSWQSDKQNLKLISINDDVIYNLLNVSILHW